METELLIKETGNEIVLKLRGNWTDNFYVFHKNITIVSDTIPRSVPYGA